MAKSGGFKRLLKWMFILFIVFVLLLIAAAIAIPYFFKDEIIEAVKVEANKSLTAELDFSDVDISLIKNFPNLTLGLSDVTLTNAAPFEGIVLADIEQTDVTLDIMTVIKSQPIAVKKVWLTKPVFDVKVLKDGTANYDITVPAKPTDVAADNQSQMIIELSKYGVSDGTVFYDDRAGDMKVEIRGLNHEGSGAITDDIYDLDTETLIDALTVNYDGIQYLRKAKADVDLVVNVDNAASKYTLKENTVKINALKADVEGWLQLIDNGYDMDLKLNAPKTAFKEILSLVPGAYTEGYEDVDASGTASLSGFLKGKYIGESYPAFKFAIDVDNGKVQYPGLPLPIQDVFTKVNLSSPGGDLDRMNVDIPTLRLKVGQDPVEGSLKVTRPMSDPQIDGRFNANLDLANLSKAYPMEGVEDLSGRLVADVDVSAAMSDVEKERYDNINLAGTASLTGMKYVAVGQPDVMINTLDMEFSPKFVELKQYDIKAGKSDLKGSGRFDNILAYFSDDLTLKGNMVVRSQLLDADEWSSSSEEETAQPAAAPAEEGEVFDRFDLALDASFKKIISSGYTLENTVVNGRMKSSELEFSELSTIVEGSDLNMSGSMSNVINYALEGEKLTGDFKLKSRKLDLNPFMTAEEPAENTKTQPEEATEPILVPENVDINVIADIGLLRYDNLDMKDVQGRISVKDQEVKLEDVDAKTLGGRVGLIGSYNTVNPEEPAFTFGYDLERLDFRESFETLNSFRLLMPLAEFIDGKFSSKIQMSGTLGSDLMPNLNTLTGDGSLFTLDAVVNNFEPLNALGDKLNFDKIRRIEVTDTKNLFTIKDGRVVIEPFEYIKDNIKMNISGSQGISSDIDYTIRMNIPREELQKNAVGAAADQGLSLLSGQASKLGVNIAQGENIVFDAFITGTAKKPKVNIKFVGTSEGNMKDAVTDAIKDKVEDVVTDKVEDVKDQATEVVTDKVEDIKDQATDIVNDKVEDVKDQVGDVVNDKVDDIKNQVGDDVKDKVDDVKDKIGDDVKDKFKDLNPFGRKKKKKDGN